MIEDFDMFGVNSADKKTIQFYFKIMYKGFYFYSWYKCRIDTQTPFECFLDTFQEQISYIEYFESLNFGIKHYFIKEQLVINNNYTHKRKMSFSYNELDRLASKLANRYSERSFALLGAIEDGIVKL